MNFFIIMAIALVLVLISLFYLTRIYIRVLDRMRYQEELAEELRVQKEIDEEQEEFLNKFIENDNYIVELEKTSGKPFTKKQYLHFFEEVGFKVN